jgi:hypothetical protein
MSKWLVSFKKIDHFVLLNHSSLFYFTELPLGTQETVSHEPVIRQVMVGLLGLYPSLHVTLATDPIIEVSSSETIPFSIDGTRPQPEIKVRIITASQLMFDAEFSNDAAALLCSKKKFHWLTTVIRSDNYKHHRHEL